MIGLILVILGALALGYGGFTYYTREPVAKVGSVEVSADRQNTVWIPPVVGGIGVAAGLVLMLVGGRKEV